MRLTFIDTALLALALQGTITYAAAAVEKPIIPCTGHSAAGTFYDLNSISLKPPEEGKKTPKNSRTDSWHARGYDYGSNFTLNICAPVLEELKDVEGVDHDLWQNVSAYYNNGGKTYSIGYVECWRITRVGYLTCFQNRQQASLPIFRGRKFVLQYRDGSPCPPIPIDDREPENTSRRKSTTISFLCERDPLAAQAAAVSFVAAADECAYFFEVRSEAACGAPEPTEQGVGPGGVFGVILLITVVVYFIGGVIYQRNVRNARGWRQLPNYSLWSGIGNFIQVRISRIPHVGGFLSRSLSRLVNQVGYRLLGDDRPKIIGTGTGEPVIPFYNKRYSGPRGSLSGRSRAWSSQGYSTFPIKDSRASE